MATKGAIVVAMDTTMVTARNEQIAVGVSPSPQHSQPQPQLPSKIPKQPGKQKSCFKRLKRH